LPQNLCCCITGVFKLPKIPI